MALIRCPECGGEVSSKANNCPHCGFPMTEGENAQTSLQEDVLYCPTCGGLNPIGSFSCTHCGRKYSVNDMITCLVRAKKNDSSIECKDVKENGNEKVAKCPRCGSTSLTANKRGFGIGKATVGTLALGLVPGLLIGNVGAKKIEVTCLKCGKKFKV